MQEQHTAGDVIIEARNAVKHFPVKTGLLSNKTVGTVRAVDDVSFSILQNQTFALVGESGCGKTTMANLILKLLDLTSGEILFRGNALEFRPGALSRWAARGTRIHDAGSRALD